MGSYVSSVPPKTDWSILHNEIQRLGEDLEVELGGPEACSIHYQRCLKNPGHAGLLPLTKFSPEFLPSGWHDSKLAEMIPALARRTVMVVVSYVSPERPDKYYLSQFRGKRVTARGSGYSHILDTDLTTACIECPLHDCPVHRPHLTTPVFMVETAKHVVFDDFEAHHTTVEFFYDSGDRSTVIAGQVLGMDCSHKGGDYARLKCVSHDLSLFTKVLDDDPVELTPSPTLRDQISPLVVIISHPHGCEKHLSVGELVSYHKESEVASRESSFKLQDVLSVAERMEPAFRTTGFHFSDLHISPTQIQDWDRLVQQDPDATWSDYCKFVLGDGYRLDYITYTAPTCPGSSGALVHILTQLPNGELKVLMGSAHLGHHRGRHNKSGIVLVPGEQVSTVDALLPTLRKRKLK